MVLFMIGSMCVCVPFVCFFNVNDCVQTEKREFQKSKNKIYSKPKPLKLIENKYSPPPLQQI